MIYFQEVLHFFSIYYLKVALLVRRGLVDLLHLALLVDPQLWLLEHPVGLVYQQLPGNPDLPGSLVVL